MKKLLTAVFLMSAYAATAQTLDDVSRYSQWSLSGTARSIGMGGAMSAVGADLSNMSYNPAGIGLFRMNSLSGSFGFISGTNTSTYIGSSNSEMKSNGQIPQLGIVFANDLFKDDNQGVVFANLGFSFNQVNDFNRRNFTTGTNTGSSYLDRLAEYATQYGIPDNLDASSLGVTEEAAFMANTIVHTGNGYYEANLPANAIMKQTYDITTGGRMNDWNMSGALNFSNRFYLGASLGLTTIRYRNTTDVSEESINTDFAKRSFENDYSYSVKGSGVNLKVGGIYRVADWIRISAAVHTRTVYNITENYSEYFTSNGFPETNYTDVNAYRLRVGPFVSDYAISAPPRYIFGVSLNYKKVALLAADYEVINYSKASIDGFNGNSTLNSAIPLYFNAQGRNIRIGAEYNYYDVRFRAGFVSAAKVYRDAEGKFRNNNMFTLGLGYQSPDGWFINGALAFAGVKDTYTPYVLENTNRNFYTADNSFRSTNFIFSIGTSFE